MNPARQKQRKNNAVGTAMSVRRQRCRSRKVWHMFLLTQRGRRGLGRRLAALLSSSPATLTSSTWSTIEINTHPWPTLPTLIAHAITFTPRQASVTTSLSCLIKNTLCTPLRRTGRLSCLHWHLLLSGSLGVNITFLLAPTVFQTSSSRTLATNTRIPKVY